MSSPHGMVFDIQRFSLHDGPGIRTLVFLKGCPLSCLWCCNPESQAPYPEIGYQPGACIGCGACGDACPSHAVTVEENSREERTRSFDRDICGVCRELPCEAACPAGALERFGREMTVEEVMRLAERDELFYRNSGGGITVSGGEPLVQADFVRELFSACRERGYHTAVETSGYCAWEELEKILDLTGLFLYDIKHTDTDRHRAFTGVDNALIIDNLKRLHSRTPEIIVRVPVIPGFNDDELSIDSIAGLAETIGIGEMHLLPYHRLGRSKYDQLSACYRMEDAAPPTEEVMCTLQDLVRQRNLRIGTGG